MSEIQDTPCHANSGNDQTPFNEIQTPMTEAQAPSNRNETPLVENPTPLAENSTLFVENPTPLTGNPTPLAENPTPLAENPTPFVENPTPLTGNSTPLAENPTPLVNHITVPIATFKSGPLKYKKKKMKDVEPEKLAPTDCCIVYEEGSSKLYFKLIDQNKFLKTGIKKHTTLEFDDVTAADLKVTSKFGSWDSMSTRLLVENRTPLIAWTVEKLADVEGLLNRKAPVKETLQNQQNDGEQTAYLRREQESCMVKATFDVQDLQQLREILHALKIRKLRERTAMLENHERGLQKDVRPLSKIREGLPEWVNYIPAKWYSSTIRQVFEYLIIIYTLLTLSWAIWQLYKHVGFIRKFLRPVLEILEFYLEMLRGWFRWLDLVTDVITDYWWMYMKPVILLATPLYTALAMLFKPLRNVANVVTMVTTPVMSCLRLMASALSPLAQPALMFWNTVRQVFVKFADSLSFIWGIVARWSIVRIVADKFQGLGLQNLLNELSNTNLDPLKAQMLVIQNLLLRSSK
eukprot:TCONS_00073704-protein